MSTFRIKASDLRDLLAPIVPLASSDDYLPVINAVRLRTQGKTLTAAATDRFRAGMTRHELEASGGKVTAIVPIAAIRSALTTFRPVGSGKRRRDPELKVTMTATRFTIEGKATAGHDTKIAVACLNAAFPAVESIILKAIQPPPDDAIPRAWLGMAPRLLAGFEAATAPACNPQTRSRSNTLVMHVGADIGSAIGITVGDHFVGCLMPRRLLAGDLGTADADLDAWRPLLGDVK